jgi:hypothetical protein
MRAMIGAVKYRNTGPSREGPCDPHRIHRRRCARIAKQDPFDTGPRLNQEFAHLMLQGNVQSCVPRKTHLFP